MGASGEGGTCDRDPRCRDRSRGEVRLDRRSARPPSRARSARCQAAQGDARHIHRRRGPQRGPAALRFDVPARAGTHAPPVARCAGPSRGRCVTLVNWKIVRRVGLVAVLAIVLYYVVTLAQVWWAARHDDTRPSEAIVVLGAAQFNGRPSDVFRARLDHAADLYRRRVAPTIVVTGGKQTGDQFTEATSGANYLHGKGVPDAAILRETTSRTSWESLSAAARVLDNRSAKKVVLVSDPFHALRIRSIANELGLDAVTSPTRSSPISGV